MSGRTNPESVLAGGSGSTEGVGRFARVARLDAYAASAFRLFMEVMMACAIDSGKSSIALHTTRPGTCRSLQ